jgi:beta-phosphoglucomutase-like phosphatase (HAD superfamily)
MSGHSGGADGAVARRARANPALVIFDCDGVLVDSEVIANRTLAQHLTAEGLTTTLDESRRRYQGLLLADVQACAEGSLGRPLSEGFLERFEEDRAEAFRRELRPVDGATEALSAVIGAGTAVCVASQGGLEKTRLSLAITGLDRLVPRDAVYSAHHVPRGKPHPDLFLHAAQANAAQAERCVVVEDSPSGITAAVAAGMRAIGYAADSDEQALRQAGAEILMSLQELPNALGLRDAGQLGNGPRDLPVAPLASARGGRAHRKPA